ncbi:hypothetical protein HDV00_000352 [Rhizophlyctis rosea]|nr:hypothetical protein HDV00_000352 [Rhizophlyctis rosea]
MARFLSEQPGFKVPRGFLDVVRKAIADRKRCAQWLHERADKAPSSIESDISHWHFITVLEHVEKILLPLQDASPNVASSPPSQATGTPPSKRADGMVHIKPFSVLDTAVESENLSVSAALPASSRSAPSLSKTSNKPPIEVEYVFIRDAAEELYMSFGFFEDLHALRTVLIGVWEDYKAKIVDLISASLITNIAVELVRNQQQEYTERLIKIVNRGSAQKDLRRFEEFAFYNIAAGIQEYLNHRGEAFLPVTETTKRKNPWNRMSREVREEHEALLLVIFLQDLDHWKVTDLTADQLVRELTDAVKRGTPTLASVFASRIFVDNCVLEDQVDRGWKESFAISQGILHALFHSPQKEMPSGYMNKMGEDLEEEFREFQTYVKGANLQGRMMAGKTVDQRTAMGTFSLRWYPAGRGSLAFNMVRSANILGRMLEENSNAILQVCYLYKMCKLLSEGEIDVGPWQDMDWIVQTQGVERFFKGPLPKDMGELWKRMQQVMGASMVGNLPEEKRRKKKAGKEWDHSMRKGFKYNYQLMETSAIFDLVGRQFEALSKGRFTMLIDFDIDALLAELKRKQPSSSTTSILTSSADNNKTPDPMTRLQHQWSQRQKQTPAETLSLLYQAFRHDAPQLSFDYFSFHTRCVEIIRVLAKKLIEPTRAFRERYSEKLTIASDDLSMMSLVLTLSRYLGSEEWGSVAQDCVSVMRDVLKARIELEGDVEVRKMEAGGWLAKGMGAVRLL